MLASNLQSVFVPDTAVRSDLEESLNVLPQFGLQHVGCHLQVLAFSVVALPVEEPSRDSVSLGFVDEFSDGIALSFGEFSGSELGVESEDFADEESEASTDTLDLVKCEGDSSLSVNVGVEDTVNVLEVVLGVLDDQRHAVDNINLLF